MKSYLPVFLAIATIATFPVIAQDGANNSSTTTTNGDPLAGVPMDKVSYFIGRKIGTQMNGQGIKPKLEYLKEGIQDALENKSSKFSEAELSAAMEKFGAAMQQVMEQKQAKSTKVGSEYLAVNAKRPGVKTTASGLQYEVLRAGDGAKPGATDTVKVNYKGTLINGDEFDSSYARNEPAEFPLNRVIPGWTEGLQLMPKGSKYRFVIPGDLAYGERGSPPKIGPNETLVFEVELLEINGK